MGISNPGWEGAYASSAARRQQRQAQLFSQQNAQRDAQAGQIENALQNPDLDPHDPKLAPAPGDAPEVAKQKSDEVANRVAQRTQLFAQHNALFQPHEAPTLAARLGGLISGKKKTVNVVSNQPAAQGPAQQPTSSAAPTAPDSSTLNSAGASDNGAPQPAPTYQNELGQTVPHTLDANGQIVPPTPLPKDSLGIPISDPNVAAAHAQPMHPMATSHPILDRLNEGLDALHNHLQGFAHPQATAPDVSSLLANTYSSPTNIARENADLAAQRAQTMQGLKNTGQITVAEIRQGGVRGQAGQPLSLESATALNENEGQPFIDRNTGKPIDLDSIAQNVPGAKLTPYYQGQRLLGYEVADQKGHIVTADNQRLPVGEFGAALPGPALGAATVAKTKNASSVDQYGNRTSSTSTTTPVTPVRQPVSSAAPVAPSDGGVPTANATALAGVNAAIAANKGKAGAPNRKAVANSAPTQPISSAAPIAPSSLKQLDANGMIPATDGSNPQVREAANQLIDDRDVDKIPTKAREAAAALARQYGWSQGKFTPREQTQVNVASNFLHKFANSPSLSVLDDAQSRLKIAAVLHDAKGMGGQMLQSLASSNLSPAEQDFIRNYQATVGTVQGLSAITRSGRPTESMVNRLKTELPNILQSANSADAKARINMIMNEIDVAKQNSSLGGGALGKGAAPTQQYKAGDQIKLKDGSTATVTGYTADGKLQVQ